MQFKKIKKEPNYFFSIYFSFIKLNKLQISYAKMLQNITLLFH